MRTGKTDQTGWMPRLIWVFAGRTAILLVLSCRGSYYARQRSILNSLTSWYTSIVVSLTYIYIYIYIFFFFSNLWCFIVLYISFLEYPPDSIDILGPRGLKVVRRRLLREFDVGNPHWPNATLLVRSTSIPHVGSTSGPHVITCRFHVGPTFAK